MAKEKKKPSKPSGRTKDEKRAIVSGLPVCVAMLICDRVIIGIDQTATIVRIVDTVGVPDDPERKVGLPVEIGGVTLFVSVKRGGADGEYPLTLVSRGPNGKRSRIGEMKFLAEGEQQRGANMVGAIRFVWWGEGLYWYELETASRKVIGRTPMKVVSGDPQTVRVKAGV